ncbi:hypothetical protein BDZ89DRAFT_242917 [Hymenopellis radicata]|nr:hypothetical protein BDZ89DRAFT_242917 [Hymenopellis radicata]
MNTARQQQISNGFGIGNGNQRHRTARQQRESTAVQRECAQSSDDDGKMLNEERRSDNEGTRINGIDAKDGHGSSRTHGRVRDDKDGNDSIRRGLAQQHRQRRPI